MINALCIDLDDFYTCLKEYGYNLSNKKFFKEETLKLLDDFFNLVIVYILVMFSKMTKI